MVRRAIAFTVIFILFMVFICTVGVVGAKTAEYMIRQHFEFQDALRWAMEDYNEIIEKVKTEILKNLI